MKKKLIVLITMLLGVMSGIRANEMTQGKRVAILPFTVKGANFDRLYAEVALDNFTTGLIKGRTYQVVERAQLDKAMKELQFQSGADFDESSAMEIGKLAGAEVVVIGIITALPNQIVVNIRGINVKTGIAEFAERDFIKKQEELLTAVEDIARRLSSSDTPDSQNYASNSDNQTNQSSTIDFSVSKEYRDTTLSYSDKKFLEKFFQQKWGIDPQDTFSVHNMYKKYLGAGIAMATVGGVCTLAGIIMTGVGGWCYDYEEYNSHYDDYDSPYWFEGFILLCIGLPTLLAVGLPLVAMSSWPFIITGKTKSIYTKITGNKSFTPRISSTGGFNGEDRKLEIAFGCSF
ncbi:MAG: hypothetical protein J6B11_10625 [Spirochaetales bacterium]|nr:hypothetical protein [Spirochaetales bacterium]